MLKQVYKDIKDWVFRTPDKIVKVRGPRMSCQIKPNFPENIYRKADVYLETSQASTMEVFEKIVSSLQLHRICSTGF